MWPARYVYKFLHVPACARQVQDEGFAHFFVVVAVFSGFNDESALVRLLFVMSTFFVVVVLFLVFFALCVHMCSINIL